MTDEFRPKEEDRPEMNAPVNDAIEAEEAIRAAANETSEQAGGDAPADSLPNQDSEPIGAVIAHEPEHAVGPVIESPPPAKTERLQKILAQAGVASRRHAEELITQGRVQVNGKVVTELGTKADAEHDHIRVDGKLLKGTERLRYFVLNKPKGFVTTVTDPEGRPTVMKFFEKMRERLYPVGRLDYASEGLLLVTNDGDLANKLTRASSGVEKTYLVKVSGQPTGDELETLRKGVGIEKGKPGSDKVRTAPALIRQVRRGENPWYEVVLIEGRNRELRKMFEEIGHHVEKIRRVGYGPLVLDQEPGKLRELDAEEVEALRKAAEGKQRTPKALEARRRHALDEQMQALTPRQRGQRPFRPGGKRMVAGRPGEFPPKDQLKGERFDRQAGGSRQVRGSGGRNAGRERGRGGSERYGSTRPVWKKDDRRFRPDERFGRENKAGAARERFDEREKAGERRSFGAVPDRRRRPADREVFQRPESGGRDRKDRGGRRGEFTRPWTDRPQSEWAGPARSQQDRPKPERRKPESSRYDRPGFEKRRPDRSGRRIVDRPGDVRREEGRDSTERRGGSGGWGSGRKLEREGRPGLPADSTSRRTSRPGTGPGGFSKSSFKGKGRAGSGRIGSRSPEARGGKRRGGPPGGRKRG